MEQNKYTYSAGRVSIVTPVYNGESHLAAMLDSVLGQTYPEIEMILVDDGSKDHTVTIAEDYRSKFAAKGYTYQIVRAEHKNASAAVNHGLPYVSGEYLIWPDSDDILEPESVARRVAFLQKYPQYACVRSLSYYFLAETGEKTPHTDEEKGNLSRTSLFWDILEAKTFTCCGCYMLKTEPFFEIYPDKKIPEYDVGQNFQMLLPFMYRHKCPTIQEELYGVCVREDSHSRRKLTREQEQQKYQNFENLIDEIAEICRIEDKPSRKRIACWKLRRRYQLARKYEKKFAAYRALFSLWQCGGFQIADAFRH